MKTVFKIKNTATGLYSTGGMSPHFSKKGKIWNAYGHVTSHLSQFNKTPKVYENCVVVEYEIKEEEISETSVKDWKEKPSTTRAKELTEIRRENTKKEILRLELERTEKRLKELRKDLYVS